MNIQQISHLFTKKKQLKRNEYLKLQDTVDTKIYYIHSGSLKISIVQDKEEQIVRFGYDGELIVALDSFITGQPSGFLIQAIKKCELWTAERADFLDFMHSSAEHTRTYISILEQLALQQIEREKDLLISSPKDRFERVFSRNPRLFQMIPNKHIANYLRMTPETLSRLKKY